MLRYTEDAQTTVLVHTASGCIFPKVMNLSLRTHWLVQNGRKLKCRGGEHELWKAKKVLFSHRRFFLVLNEAIKKQNLFLWGVSWGWTVQIITSTQTPTLLVSCVLKAFNQSVIILSGFNRIHTPTALKLPKVVPTSHISPYPFPFINDIAGLWWISLVYLILDWCWFTGPQAHLNVKWDNCPDLSLFFFLLYFSSLHEISSQQKLSP